MHSFLVLEFKRNCLCNYILFACSSSCKPQDDNVCQKTEFHSLWMFPLKTELGKLLLCLPSAANRADLLAPTCTPPRTVLVQRFYRNSPGSTQSGMGVVGWMALGKGLPCIMPSRAMQESTSAGCCHNSISWASPGQWGLVVLRLEFPSRAVTLPLTREMSREEIWNGRCRIAGQRIFKEACSSVMGKPPDMTESLWLQKTGTALQAKSEIALNCCSQVIIAQDIKIWTWGAMWAS